MVEVHCLEVLKIVHHHANGCFDWLISDQQSVNPSREAISILSGKYKAFTSAHPVIATFIAQWTPAASKQTNGNNQVKYALYL